MRIFKSFVFLAIVMCLAAGVAFGQKKTAPKKPVGKKTVPAKTVLPSVTPKIETIASTREISAVEWKNLTDALDKENWTQAAQLIFAAMNKLKVDNGKKQLAQLRYFYLFALAGRAASGSLSYAELEKIADGLVGSEFLMPSRQFLTNCTKKVNYICESREGENILRVTATNKSGSAIHLFEYVKFDEKPNQANDGKSVFLGGVLKSVEVNKYQQNISILRLVFDKGFSNLAASR